jgi:hypothetical protein
MARHKDAFLVHLWFESCGQDDAQPVAWRGSVTHLMSQERRYFTEIVDLVTFLTGYTPKNSVAASDHGTTSVTVATSPAGSAELRVVLPLATQ